MRLSNPLSVEERLQMPRLTEHDFRAISRHMAGEAYFANRDNRRVKEGYISGIYDLISSVTNCVSDLICFDELYMDSSFSSSFFKNLQIAAKASSGKLRVDSRTMNITGVTRRSIMQTVMFNVIKNGIKARGNTGKKVELTSSSCQGFPDDTLYIPEGAKDLRDFIRFEFANDGAFPENILIKDRLTGPPPAIGSSGFGLYFIGRAAKFLRMPVDIKSANGLTKVVLYHPNYNSD